MRFSFCVLFLSSVFCILCVKAGPFIFLKWLLLSLRYFFQLPKHIGSLGFLKIFQRRSWRFLSLYYCCAFLTYLFPIFFVATKYSIDYFHFLFPHLIVLNSGFFDSWERWPFYYSFAFAFAEILYQIYPIMFYWQKDSSYCILHSKPASCKKSRVWWAAYGLVLFCWKMELATALMHGITTHCRISAMRWVFSILNPPQRTLWYVYVHHGVVSRIQS